MAKIAPDEIGNLASIIAVPQDSESPDDSFAAQEQRHDLLFGEKLARSEMHLESLNSMNKSNELGKKLALPSQFSLREIIVSKSHSIKDTQQLQAFGVTRLHKRRGANQYVSEYENLSAASRMTKWYIFSRQSIKRALFDTFMDILVAWSVISSLYFLGFEHPTGDLFIFDQVIRVLFMIEIVTNFFTALPDSWGDEVTDIRIIAKSYLTHWFLLDLLTVIPIGEMTGNFDIEYICRLVRITRLPDALDMINGKGFSQLILLVKQRGTRNENIAVNYQLRYLGTFMQLFINMILICYSVGCIWFWYSREVAHEPYSDEHFVDDNAKLTDENNRTKLLRSWFFALTTISTVGYGDYLPKNNSELALIILILLVGVGVFAYIMGSFNSAVTDYDSLNPDDENLSRLNIWLDSLEEMHGKIKKPKLKQAIIEHFIYYYSHDRLRELAKSYWSESTEDLVNRNQPYFENLPKKVSDRILDYLFSDVFYHFRYFLDTAHSRFRYAICCHFQPRKFEVGEILLKEGDLISEILLILDGDVAAGPIAEGGVQKMIMKYRDGKSVIGVFPALTENPALTTYKAVGQERVNALAIPIRPFIDILDNFYPDIRSKMLADATKAYKILKHHLVEEISRISYKVVHPGSKGMLRLISTHIYRPKIVIPAEMNPSFKWKWVSNYGFWQLKALNVAMFKANQAKLRFERERDMILEENYNKLNIKGPVVRKAMKTNLQSSKHNLNALAGPINSPKSEAAVPENPSNSAEASVSSNFLQVPKADDQFRVVS